MSFENELRRSIKTGKVVFGAKETIKLVKLGKAKAVIMASLAKPELKEDLRYYAKLSGIPVYVYRGSPYDLGSLCGKPFPVSMLAIVEPGDSSIVEIVSGGGE